MLLIQRNVVKHLLLQTHTSVRNLTKSPDVLRSEFCPASGIGKMSTFLCTVKGRNATRLWGRGVEMVISNFIRIQNECSFLESMKICHFQRQCSTSVSKSCPKINMTQIKTGSLSAVPLVTTVILVGCNTWPADYGVCTASKTY